LAKKRPLAGHADESSATKKPLLVGYNSGDGYLREGMLFFTDTTGEVGGVMAEKLGDFYDSAESTPPAEAEDYTTEASETDQEFEIHPDTPDFDMYDEDSFKPFPSLGKRRAIVSDPADVKAIGATTSAAEQEVLVADRLVGGAPRECDVNSSTGNVPMETLDGEEKTKGGGSEDLPKRAKRGSGLVSHGSRKRGGRGRGGRRPNRPRVKRTAQEFRQERRISDLARRQVRHADLERGDWGGYGGKVSNQLDSRSPYMDSPHPQPYVDSPHPHSVDILDRDYISERDRRSFEILRQGVEARGLRLEGDLLRSRSFHESDLSSPLFTGHRQQGLFFRVL